MESIKIYIFQKKNIIKKKTFEIMFIHSLNLETIQYLCRFHNYAQNASVRGSFTALQQPYVYSHMFTAGLQLEVWGSLTLCGLGVFGVCSDTLLIWNRHDGLDRHGALRHGFCWVSIQVSWGWKNDNYNHYFKSTEINILKGNILTGHWITNRLPVPIIYTKLFFFWIRLKNGILL